MSKIGAAIKAARKAHGMTSAQVAEGVMRTPQYIRVIECGAGIPSLPTVREIAHLFPESVDSAAWSWLWLRDTVGDLVADAMWRYAAKAEVLDAVRPGEPR